MKEHVKWWKIRSQECTTDFYDTEAAWRAALEWARTKLTGDIMLSKWDRGRIDSTIKKEVEE